MARIGEPIGEAPELARAFPTHHSTSDIIQTEPGEMAEWLKAAVC